MLSFEGVTPKPILCICSNRLFQADINDTNDINDIIISLRAVKAADVLEASPVKDIMT